MYITEIPVVALLSIVIKYNGSAEGFLKLYPLMIALIGAFVFIFIYLFRFITISNDMVKSVGPFSTRDRALITKDKTLVLTLRKRGKIRVELFGYDDAPTFSWVKVTEFEKKRVNLYRDRAVGGKGAIKRVLRFFDIPEEDIAAALESESFSGKYENYELSAEIINEEKAVKITFLETL